MSALVSCPACGSHLKAPKSMAGRKAKCPRCAQRMLIPTSIAPAPSPVLIPMPPIRRPPPSPEADESRRDSYEGPTIIRLEERNSDPPGVLGLTLGAVATCCLLLGFVTCGLTYLAAAPLATVGVICSTFGRGNMRVAGLCLNFLTLIPALTLFVGFLLVMFTSKADDARRLRPPDTITVPFKRPL